MNLNRWGVIGPGNIARTFVKDLSFVGPPEQRVTAVLGQNMQHTHDFAKAYNVPDYYTELKDFLKNKNMDVVYIASPHPYHYEQAMACLENRLPVLCEKPMSINAEQCSQLIEASRQNKTFLMEGMWLRFLPSIQQVLHIIEQGMIGQIVSIKASISFKTPYDPNSRFFDPEQGGGSLLDLGIYPVFLSLLLLGKPNYIKAIGKLSDKGVDETCSILLHYKSGAYTILESSFVSTLEIPAEIVGEKGIIKILSPWFEKASGIELQRNDEGKIIYPCHWDGHGLYFEAWEVLRCIQDKQIESKLMPHSFSLDMIKILDEIRNKIHVAYDMYE